jgi:hypothetical protein
MADLDGTMATFPTMKESERQAAVVRLWLELPNAGREGDMALLRFHVWLLANRPELLSKAPGHSYQHLKTDLRNYLTASQLNAR